MIRIALTGGIACGKTLAGSFFLRQDVPVCEADVLAHDLMRKGRPVWSGVIRLFGRGILGPDGEIDRRKLGREVFGHRDRLERLNRITHPAVITGWEDWLACQEQRGFPAAVVIIPLLYEIGADKGCKWDYVVCLHSSEEVQVGRLAGRGFGREEAMLRIRAMMSSELKMARSDFVIVNNGEAYLLERQADRVLKRMLER